FATQVALLHVGFRRAHPLQRASDVIDVIVSFPRRTKVRLSDDLRERDTSAIQIDIRIAIDLRQTFVNVLSRIFFEVQARYPDLLRTPLERMTGFVTLSGHDLEFTVG